MLNWKLEKLCKDRGVRILTCNQVEELFDFGKVYSVKGQNMKKLDCPGFPMVRGPMFYWSGPPGAKENFNLRIKGGTTVKKLLQ